MASTSSNRPRARTLRGAIVLSVLSTLALGTGASRVANAAPTSASSSLEESLADDARERFSAGLRLYKASEFEAARESFLAAYAKSGEPRVLYNVAVCDKALGKYARAIRSLRRSLATTDRPLPADYAQRTAETIATLSRYVAFVTVDSPVEGATFTVDGEPVTESPTALETGTHTITATRDGYEDASTTVTVKAGEAQRISLPLELSQKPGTANVSCATTPCEIFVGDERLGVAPVSFSRSQGSYVVRAFVQGRPYAEERVTLQNGKVTALTLVGRPIPMARLRVRTDQAADVVSIDGARVGKSGALEELLPGEHRIQISRADGASKSLDVVLHENETRDISVTIDPPPSKGISPWWFVGGGTVVAASAATVAAILLSNQSTKYEGSSAGTLNPYVVTASHGARR